VIGGWPATIEVIVAFRAELEDFDAFYERTYPGAYRTALAIVRDPGLAADVTQDAYVNAYRDRARFRGDAPVVAWFHRILVNAALAGLRRRSSRPREIPADELRGRVSGDEASSTSDRLSVLAALGSLDPRSRAVVVLRYYHDHDYATIGRILDTSPGNVGVLLTRALDRLRIVLEPEPEPASAVRRDPTGGLR
jgi:RNA polymerase sigma factor (sigma-70 family)